MNTGCAAVDQVGQMNIQGNVIPPMWYKNLTFKNGKPHFVAITILSDILYWYRPTVVRDEATGLVQEYKKKFKSDMLQRGYQSFSEQFGFTKRQVKEAFDFLEEHGFITREFRNIEVSGTKLNNVMYISPVPENIQLITHDEYDITLLRSDVPPPTLERTTLLHSDVPGHTLERRTNTITTQEITTNNYVIDDAPAPEPEINPFHFFQENGFGVIGSYIADRMKHWCEDLTDELVVEALKLSVEQGKKSWSYTEAILKSWLEKGVRTVEDAQADQREFQEKRARAIEKPRKQSYSRRPLREEKLPDWFTDNQETPSDPGETKGEEEDYDFEAEKAKLEAELKEYRKGGGT